MTGKEEIQGFLSIQVEMLDQQKKAIQLTDRFIFGYTELLKINNQQVQDLTAQVAEKDKSLTEVSTQISALMIEVDGLRAQIQAPDRLIEAMDVSAEPAAA